MKSLTINFSIFIKSIATIVFGVVTLLLISFAFPFDGLYEHSEQARAPHTNVPRDVPRCGALSLLKKNAASQVLHRCAQAVSRGAACCASQVLDRVAHADARGATRVLDHVVQAVSRGAARCALHVQGRSARTDACGRSFAVLSTQVSTVGLRLRFVVPRTMPSAVASRCCRRRFQQLSCT